MKYPAVELRALPVHS